MYERNVIIIDKHFINLFGYDRVHNLKNNSENYFELIEKIENYQIVSEKENNVMEEFEKVANRIRETQKYQEILNKRILKYMDSRKELFENLEENEELLNSKFEKVQSEIDKNNNETKENIKKFVEEITDFNEKSEIRNKCGSERKIVESDYQRSLNITTDNFNQIDKEKLKEIKSFIKLQDKTLEKENIKQKILKNGEKEKVKFDNNAISKAIDVSTDIAEKRVGILLSIYDKTNKLLAEVKEDEVDIKKHKKIVKDAKSKLKFLNAIDDYLILFLDNERMNIMSGEKEHKKIMSEACEHLKSDLKEIQNMYSLLLKEMNGKASKKTYKDLYHLEYLFDLQDEEKVFEKSVSKLNIIGSVIYPDYWRIEGMQRIYDTFKDILSENYEKDLTEYEPLNIACDVNKDILKIEEENVELADNVEKNTNIAEKDNDLINDNLTEDNKENVKEEEKSNEEIEEEASNTDNEEFVWDIDEEDEELNFEDTEENDEDDEENENIIEKDNVDYDDNDEKQEEIEDENKMDKAIDELLGFFDEDDEELDDDSFNDENIIIRDDDEKNENKVEDVKEVVESRKRKGSLFGRRKN